MIAPKPRSGRSGASRVSVAFAHNLLARTTRGAFFSVHGCARDSLLSSSTDSSKSPRAEECADNAVCAALGGSFRELEVPATCARSVRQPPRDRKNDVEEVCPSLAVGSKAVEKAIPRRAILRGIFLVAIPRFCVA